MRKRNVHTTPGENGGWNVKREGAERASKHFDKKVEAEQFGKDLAKKDKTEHIIHTKDGKIQKRDSYGNDPYPPKG